MTKPGNKSYTVQYLPVVVKEHIPLLSSTAKIRIKKAIEERLTVDPLGFGKPLRYSFKGHRRLRVGDYRVIYRVEPKIYLVLVVAIKLRRDSYEEL
ncbi:MAG: type II toxin-antitoxin system RelE/ParE family toxin [Gammaproteobacteria bacterium]|jgi:mRNA-degrading endonuclease RelE of RelBE toxin-antitoxin system